MKSTYYASWSFFYQQTLELGKLVTADHKIVKIMPVLRGGLLPGVILSHNWNISIPGVINPKFPELTRSVDADVLVIDEICDTGATFARIKPFFPNAIYAAVFVKTMGKRICKYWAEDFSQDVWVHMPWEI